MTAAVDNLSAADLARRIADLGETPPALLPVEAYHALAWALKDRGYAAWSSQPQRAAAAAAALRELATQPPQDAPHAIRSEVGAVADWLEGIACLTRGEMNPALRCFDAAAAGFAAIGQANHATQTQVPKIMALSMLGQHAAAAECAQRTQAEFLQQGDVAAAGKVSLNLGSLHLRRDAYAESSRHYRQAAVLFARVGDHQHSVMADIGMADALTSMGDIDEALRIYARARMRAQTHGFPVLDAMVEESVALLQLARGRYREALAGLEGSRAHYEQLAMPQHLAIAEKQLGDAYLELRLLPEAIAVFERAIAKFTALEMPDDEAWTLAQHGRTLALQGDGAQAMASFGRAEALFRAQGNGVGNAAVSLARAELSLSRNDGAAALAFADRAATGFAAAELAEGQARADTLRAQALVHMGRAADADALFTATLARARALGALATQVRCLTGLGLCAQAMGRHDGAHRSFNAAIELFEEQRRALPGDELRAALLANHLRPYQELLRMAIVAHAEADTPAAAASVLRELERVRARSLDERLTQLPREVADDAETLALRTRLSWLHRRVQRLQEEGEAPTAFAAELREKERELLERTRRARLTSATKPAGSLHEDDAPMAEMLQRALGADDAVVEYGVIGDELFACIVDRQGVHVQRHVGHWPDVLAAIDAVQFQMDTLRHGVAPMAHHMSMLTARARARLGHLYDTLWRAVAPWVAQRRRVIVVPHGRLGSVPFAALGDGERCLGDMHEIAFAPSARIALRGLGRQPAAARRVLALGESSRLVHAAAEAELVAGLFREAHTLVGENATLDRLRVASPKADVIHLACHGQFRTDNPMFSALHLLGDPLTVEAAERLALGPATVVLSACETGMAEQASGDEMFGLVRAFMVAGAARVIATLWPVDDEVTCAFMSHFYLPLRGGETPAAALRAAQQAVKAQHPHPFHWAGFVLHGGW